MIALLIVTMFVKVATKLNLSEDLKKQILTALLEEAMVFENSKEDK